MTSFANMLLQFCFILSGLCPYACYRNDLGILLYTLQDKDFDLYLNFASFMADVLQIQGHEQFLGPFISTSVFKL